MSPGDLPARIASALEAHDAARVWEAARETGIMIGLGGHHGLMVEPYPKPGALLAAVTKGDPKRSPREREEMRACGIVLLAQLDGEAALLIARELLASADQQVVQRAAEALAVIPSDAALEALLTGREDSAPRWCSLHCRVALGKSRHPDAGKRLLAEAEAMAKKGPDAMLKHGYLVAALGELRHEPALPFLRALVKKKGMDPMGRAAKALERFGSAAIGDPEKALASRNGSEREVAVRAVLARDPKRAYDVLRPFFRELSDATDTAETTLSVLVRDINTKKNGWFDADPRWKKLCAEILAGDETPIDSWAFEAFFDRFKDVKKTAALARLRSYESLPHGFSQYLFRLGRDAAPAIEREAKRFSGVDAKTLRNVVKHLREKA